MRPGKAWQGAAGRGWVWQGKARILNQHEARLGLVRRSGAGHGLAWLGLAWLGKARHGFQSPFGTVGYGMPGQVAAWRGAAGQGKDFESPFGLARLCKVWQVWVGLGKARILNQHTAGHGLVRQGVARRGKAWIWNHHKAGQGRARRGWARQGF